MEIINADSAMLSNYEVLTLLNDQKAQRQANEVAGTREVAENLRTVEFEVQKYLSASPCTTQSPEQIVALKKALSAYELMKVELLQILNLRPKSPVELLLVIEEFEERFTMEDCEAMLRIILESLPRDDDEVMAEAENNVEDQEA
ncbi:HRDC-like protein [Lobosporangium transversale]|uniref:DNA-directed RNA polymerase III subunit RPC9 n=1 Tax=Lobosporangium transversale TaxID=64571 RepID=A0A1Y2GUY8_9FUNG|nr:HRDC-like protein [Lobosporangium transversale]ORZ22782.1 HRDC-like protein [Lobosporangium transversale]|eukprot:XP_021883336.1 HRDC-like protein [Lobosporangium transversale]